MADSQKSRSVDRPHLVIFIACALFAGGGMVIWSPGVDTDLREGSSWASDQPGVYDLGHVPSMPSGSVRLLEPLLSSDDDPSGVPVYHAWDVR